VAGRRRGDEGYLVGVDHAKSVAALLLVGVLVGDGATYQNREHCACGLATTKHRMLG
jgi:hypothetical protein